MVEKLVSLSIGTAHLPLCACQLLRMCMYLYIVLANDNHCIIYSLNVSDPGLEARELVYSRLPHNPYPSVDGQGYGL